LLAGAVVLAGLAGCGGRQSTLDPHSKAASDITTLWWWMLVVAGIVFLGAVAMLVAAYFRRGVEGLPFIGKREQANNVLVIVFGFAIPAVVLIALFIVADLFVIRDTQAPAKGSTAMTVDVTSHQWWWEVRYPGTKAVTANEIHIPVDTRVRLVGRTSDVIHSFWVPELNRKIDLIPGQTNKTLLYADEPSVYRGQCAEFCGLQHAHMAFEVIAEPQAAFQAWLRRESAPARPPAGASERQGQAVFDANQCASCHTIRGTSAKGTVGPDLTHVGSRQTLASDTIPNTHSELESWIANPQAIKPGTVMPALPLTRAQLTDVAAYLRSLR
jgi:cytochrome c oxidase subunit II